MFLGSVGDKQLQLLQAGNIKLNILMLVMTLSVVANVALGIWILYNHHDKTSNIPADLTCVDLAAKLENALQAINQLSELVTTLTMSTQDSPTLTSSFNTSARPSWSGRPRYTWG